MVDLITRIYRNITIGDAPDVIWDKCNYDRSDKPYTKTQITQTIDEILKNHIGKPFKIGKTGNPENRTDGDQYREIKTITKFFVLYQHTSKDVISDFELYYIRKYKELFPRRCLNKSQEHGGNMVSLDGYYYVYLVT